MKREALSLAVMILFASSLVATSKPKSSPDGGQPAASGTVGSRASTTSSSAAGSEQAAMTSEPRSLPDTSSWAKYTFAPGKLEARTPPGANVTCTKTAEFVHCILMRGKKMLGTFGGRGETASAMAARMKADRRGRPKIIFEAGSEIAIHRDDPKLGSYCEYVAESPTAFRSAFGWVEGMDPAAFKMIALDDNDCLDTIAFAHTLRSSK